MNRLAFLAFCASMLLLGAGPLDAQTDPNTPVSAEAVPAPAERPGPPAVAEPGYESAQQLPARPAPPRTLRDHWHVFIAFSVTWLLLFGYALSLGRRWARLERRLAQLTPRE